MVDEYWIVDPEQRSAEVYRFAEAARAGAEPTPELRRGRLLWAPAAGLLPLDIDLTKIWI